jgi:hypothetical protein
MKNKRKIHRWEEIIPLFSSMTASEIARKFNMNHAVVSGYATAHGLYIMKKRERYLKLFHDGKSDADIASILNVTRNSVTQIRIRYGVSPKYDHSQEARLQREFVKTIDIPYSEYVSCSAGIIDILTDRTIYELKNILSASSFQSAIGQLFTYSISFPEREKIIVCNHITNASNIKLAHILGIEIIEFHNSNAENRL